MRRASSIVAAICPASSQPVVKTSPPDNAISPVIRRQGNLIVNSCGYVLACPMLAVRRSSRKVGPGRLSLTRANSVDSLPISYAHAFLEFVEPVNRDTPRPKQLGAATRDTRKGRKEPFLTQIASFVELFVWLLVLKSFFLPLFIIPTGSMAETLSGAHATYTCPNCGYEYPVGFHDPEGPRIVQCPN